MSSSISGTIGDTHSPGLRRSEVQAASCKRKPPSDEALAAPRKLPRSSGAKEAAVSADVMEKPYQKTLLRSKSAPTLLQARLPTPPLAPMVAFNKAIAPLTSAQRGPLDVWANSVTRADFDEAHLYGLPNSDAIRAAMADLLDGEILSQPERISPAEQRLWRQQRSLCETIRPRSGSWFQRTFQVLTRSTSACGLSNVSATQPQLTAPPDPLREVFWRTQVVLKNLAPEIHDLTGELRKVLLADGLEGRLRYRCFPRHSDHPFNIADQLSTLLPGYQRLDPSLEALEGALVVTATRYDPWNDEHCKKTREQTLKPLHDLLASAREAPTLHAERCGLIIDLIKKKIDSLRGFSQVACDAMRLFKDRDRISETAELRVYRTARPVDDTLCCNEGIYNLLKHYVSLDFVLDLYQEDPAILKVIACSASLDLYRLAKLGPEQAIEILHASPAFYGTLLGRDVHDLISKKLASFGEVCRLGAGNLRIILSDEVQSMSNAEIKQRIQSMLSADALSVQSHGISGGIDVNLQGYADESTTVAEVATSLPEAEKMHKFICVYAAEASPSHSGESAHSCDQTTLSTSSHP